MPKHDLPDGNEDSGNLIDFREYLRRRVDQTAQDNDAPASEPSIRDVYGRAEHGDGRTPRFNRYDLLWLGMILIIAALFWMVPRR